ncbi:methyltransferase domain-containing protein [Streptomyces sp. NPDC008121]|uniref:class I SAM-dependent methyltransferase n=1 Tax=Streptomyces sp. NPDC008121 TaxID=3364809 RepID=UPI0036F04B1D
MSPHEPEHGHRHRSPHQNPHPHGGQPRQGAGHGHHEVGHAVDWAEMAVLLERQAEIESPLYAEAAAWLGTLLPDDGVRRILDIGSGPGVLTALLAEAFPAAETVAVDGTPELLERARDRAEARGLGGRLTTLHAELPAAIGGLGDADLLWAANTLHHMGDQRAALAAFAERLRPGGLLVLVEGGLPARHLPWNQGIGRPGLEARLDALHAEWFGEMRSALPGARDEVDDWPALLFAAGLTPAGTRTFLADSPAPVAPVVREQAVAHFERLRVTYEGSAAEDDLKALDRLLDPSEPLSLPRRTDLFRLAARTVHAARKG